MNNKTALNLCAFAATFLWAAAFPLTKIAGEEFSPYSMGLIRCVVASTALLAIGRLLHIRKPFRKKDILILAVTGAMGFTFYLIFFNTGLITITSATSSVIISATPILTALLCSMLYQEKITPTGWLAIFLAFLGVILLLFWNGVFSIDIGVIWTLGAAIVFCLYNVLNRKLSASGYTSVEIVTYGMLSAALMLLAFLPETLGDLTQASLSNIIILIGLGLLPSATSYLLWAKALALADKTNEVTNYMFLTPLLSAVMGFFLLGEIPDAGTFIGGAVIIVSVILFNLKGK